MKFFNLGGADAAPATAPPTSAGSSFFGAPAATAAPAAPAAAAATAAAPASSFFGFGGAAATPSDAASSGSAKAPTLASMQAAVTGQDPEDAAWEAKCALTRTQRFTGFAICLGIGCVISFIGSFKIGQPVAFALLYSLGNVVSFASTGFLVGPRKQCRMACDASRRFSTFFFLASMLATILTATLYKGAGATVLCILLIVVQFCALVWYTASYIPFGRAMIASTCQACVGRLGGAAAAT